MAPRLLRFGIVPAVAVVLLLSGCGGSSGAGSEGDADAGAASASCTGLLKGADPSAVPPGVKVDGVTWYEKTSQGATHIYYGYLNGDDVQQTRDGIVNTMKSAKFSIDGEDAEDNTEAEAEFGGPANGTLQVVHLCQDHLRIRVTVE
jgi:hypothetical protein